MDKKIIVFNSELSAETVGQLINSLQNTKEKNIDLYFCTSGGDTGCKDVLVHYINNTLVKNKKNLTLYANGFIQSSGVLFLLEVNCKKIILPSTSIMIHKIKAYLNEKELKLTSKSTYSHKTLFTCTESENETMYELYRKNGFSEEIIDHVKSGIDVYINNEDLMKILNGSEVKFRDIKNDLPSDYIKFPNLLSDSSKFI
ncbi:MAG: ATP-dependent Clp protease proteolytic subunit [Fusobacteriaceae bacterium]|nr:ATP-dependent Clp protease proteolytic subunit [Fusobacteriaceae bacterium]